MNILSISLECWNTVLYALRHESTGLRDNYQGNAVVNYTEREVPYTRIIEHKHFEFGTQPDNGDLQRISERMEAVVTNHIIRSMIKRMKS